MALQLPIRIGQADHDVLSHVGLTGVNSFDSTAHGTTDHAGITGVNSFDSAAHGSTDHAGLTGVNPSGLQVAAVTITSAQILALNTAPITLVAAQGSGTFIVVESIAVLNDFGTAAYVVNAAGFTVRYTDGTGSIIGVLTQAFGQLVADGVAQIGDIASDGVTDPLVEDVPVVLFADTADPTTGDGEFDLSVTYRVVTFP